MIDIVLPSPEVDAMTEAIADIVGEVFATATVDVVERTDRGVAFFTEHAQASFDWHADDVTPDVVEDGLRAMAAKLIEAADLLRAANDNGELADRATAYLTGGAT